MPRRQRSGSLYLANLKSSLETSSQCGPVCVHRRDQHRPTHSISHVAPISKAMRGVGYAIGTPRLLPPIPDRMARRIEHWVARQRLALSKAIFHEVPGVRGAVAVALLTGDRGAIPEKVWSNLRDSGLAHLLAISGLHVGLMAGLLFTVARAALALFYWLARIFPVKKWAAVISLIGAFGYLQVTGSTIPTQRAFLMIGMGLTEVMLDRVPFSMTVVAWAALVILLITPESLMTAGFQMSFAAVVALISAYEAMGPILGQLRSSGGWGRRVCLYCGGVLLTTLIAGTATSPFAAFHFNRVATYGLAANLFAVPVMALWIMPWGLATYFMLPFGWQNLGLVPMTAGIGFVLDVAERGCIVARRGPSDSDDAECRTDSCDARWIVALNLDNASVFAGCRRGCDGFVDRFRCRPAGYSD